MTNARTCALNNAANLNPNKRNDEEIVGKTISGPARPVVFSFP